MESYNYGETVGHLEDPRLNNELGRSRLMIQESWRFGIIFFPTVADTFFVVPQWSRLSFLIPVVLALFALRMLTKEEILAALPLGRHVRQGVLVFNLPPVVLVFAIGDLEVCLPQFPLLHRCRGQGNRRRAGVVSSCNQTTLTWPVRMPVLHCVGGGGGGGAQVVREERTHPLDRKSDQVLDGSVTTLTIYLLSPPKM